MKYRYREPHELKESDIEWIGKIPKEWKHVKLRYLCKIDTGGRDTQDNEEEGEYPFFVRSDTVERINSYSFDGEAILTAGDGVGVGKVFHYYNGKFDFHQRVYKLSDFKDINGKYLYYFIKENFYKLVLKISAKSTVDSLRMPMFKDFEVSFPEKLTKQFLIASFLDRKCAEFDGIVEKKESIISKLEEAKKSLISEVVTGKVKIENGKIISRKEEEMKDSGIEWIGKIPKEWEVTRVKRFLESQKQGFYTTEDYADSGVKLVRITDINDSSEISYEKCPHVEINEKDKRIFDLKKGDFLFARSGTIGRFGVVENEENAVFASYLIRFRFSNIKERYLKHYFSSELFKACLFSSLHGGANQNIHAENIKEPFLMVPSDFEQSLIASFLDKKTEEIDSVITKIRDQIEKIKKAKQSLISEAVTGKIEVMG